MSFVLLVATSCEEKGESSDDSAARHRRIALVGDSENEPTWPVLLAAAARFERDEPEFKVDVIAPRDFSPKDQQKILADLLDQDVRAICLVPTDAAAVKSVVNQLVKSGRPVLTIGRDVPRSNRSVFCGPSELEIGKHLAAACARTLSGQSGTVITLNADSQDTAYQVRIRAFKDELPTHGVIQILKEIDCRGNILDAVNAVRVESRNYPRVGCWVMFDDWPLRATPAEDRLLPLGCRMVLCNGAPKYIDRVRRGEIASMITFDFLEAVRQSLMAARGIVEDATSRPPPFVMIETETIDADDIEAYKLRWDYWRVGRPSPPKKPSE